ncbi:MAG TPA: helix-turn-helix transcriptional regulator, partial [Polyangia bacterium]|nr:helix-turn-helix transcriptional regulator [Polyangia bacterium]
MMIPGALRQLRAERNLTQHALAKAAGLDVGTISDFEVGKDRTPNAETLNRLAEALDKIQACKREQFAFFDANPDGDGFKRAQLATRVKPPAPGPPMAELVRTSTAAKLARV